MKFLGHQISAEGIKVDNEKVKALDTWPVPTSAREVRQLLGFMSYYRKFVPRLAQIAKPLHALVGGEKKSRNLCNFHLELRMPSRIRRVEEELDVTPRPCISQL